MPSEVISTGSYTLLHKKHLDLEAPCLKNFENGEYINTITKESVGSRKNTGSSKKMDGI
jgi:hypothetical protein